MIVLRKIIAICLAAMMLTPVVSNAQPRYVHCNYQRVRLVIACAVSKWPVPRGLSHALYIANRESRFNPRARNTSSGACGIYQHLPKYWPGRVATFKHDHPYYHVSWDCYGAKANVLTTIWMVHRYSGWGPWGG